MALNEKRTRLWHAFHSLDDSLTGSVPKSQLKVLTHNIASILGLQNDGSGLNEYMSTPTLTLNEYLYYMQVEVFDCIKENDTFGSNDRLDKIDKEDRNKIDIDKVDDVCWMICKRKYLNRENRIILDEDVLKLWKIFNFLAETDEEGKVLLPVVMDSQEVACLGEKYTQIIGRPWKTKEFDSVADEINTFYFQQMLNFLETWCSLGLSGLDVGLAIKELYEEIICDVIKKGFLTKKGQAFANWKDRWFVLLPTVLSYYVSSDLKECKGEIKLDSFSKVEPISNKSLAKANRFVVKGVDRSIEISAPDIRTKNAWIRAIESAIAYCSQTGSYQKAAFKQRKQARDALRNELQKQEKKKHEEEENVKREREDLQRRLTEKESRLKEVNEMGEKKRLILEEKLKEGEDRRKREEEKLNEHQRQLEQEKLARAEAELRFEEEARLREAEQQRLRELEDLQKQLEERLEAESRAKRDEEIVRTLQSRLLEEEFQKREMLENIQVAIEESLASERQKRENLEEERQEQEMIMEEERKKLEALELERKATDEKLQNAIVKLAEAEREKKKTQSKLKAREKPIGLARCIQPEPNPHITHRGLGAFSELEFQKKRSAGVQESESGDDLNDGSFNNNEHADSGVDA